MSNRSGNNSNSPQAGRIYYLDIARSLAVIWIVGFWHLREYLPHSLSFFGDANMTDVALGVFMLLSGFFLAKYHFTCFRHDAWVFYKKRFIRIYILYAISAITLYVSGYNPGFRLLVTTLTGTALYIPPQPNTLWFLTMLLNFYVFTPFIHSENRRSFLLRILTLYLFLLGARMFFGGIDFRFFWCFPLYCFGLYWGKNPLQITNEMQKVWKTAVCFGLLVGILLFFYFHPVNYKLHYVILPLGIYVFLSLSYCLAALPVSKLVEPIAYSSMCAYLFHRQIYSLLWNSNWLDATAFPTWLFFVFSIVVCFSISYVIQYLYDHYIQPLLTPLHQTNKTTQ